VLVGIARFWSSAGAFLRTHSQQFVMHGVTGPNEYDNNVNNNWYTNYIAVWCMRYAMEAHRLRERKGSGLGGNWKLLQNAIKFYEYHRNQPLEGDQWQHVSSREDEKRGVFLQAGRLPGQRAAYR
jgi:maltose phosphorylase